MRLSPRTNGAPFGVLFGLVGYLSRLSPFHSVGSSGQRLCYLRQPSWVLFWEEPPSPCGLNY
jgi:hypothetical protein